MGFVQEEPQVQVIVPARNEQECIGACLESLVSQQGIAFQITVVDDGSTLRVLRRCPNPSAGRRPGNGSGDDRSKVVGKSTAHAK